MGPYNKQLRDQYARDYEILNITTTDADYVAVTFTQPVKYYRIKVRASGQGRFRKAAASGAYESIGPGEVLPYYADQGAATVGYVAREGSSNVTFEVVGFF